MSPIRITSKIAVKICVGERELTTLQADNAYFDVEGRATVLPEGKDVDFTVTANGFRNAPGGMIESQRLSPGHNLDELTLTTPEDSELRDELGLSEITIDGVKYTAINPQQK